jgi:hypothetical protein
VTVSDIKLGSAVESVEAHVALGDVRFRVVVVESVLRKEFAAGDQPGGWLEAFHANAAVIEQEAARLFQVNGRSPVILYRVGPPPLPK